MDGERLCIRFSKETGYEIYTVGGIADYITERDCMPYGGKAVRAIWIFVSRYP